MKLSFPRQIFEKYPNIKFHEKFPSCGSRVVPCGQTERQYTTKLMVVFRNCAKGPKNFEKVQETQMTSPDILSGIGSRTDAAHCVIITPLSVPAQPAPRGTRVAILVLPTQKGNRSRGGTAVLRTNSVLHISGRWSLNLPEYYYYYYYY